MSRRRRITRDVLNPEALPDGFSRWSDDDQSAYIEARTAELRAFAALPAAAKCLLMDLVAQLREQRPVDDDGWEKVYEANGGYEELRRRFLLAAPAEVWLDFLEAVRAELASVDCAERRLKAAGG